MKKLFALTVVAALMAALVPATATARPKAEWRQFVMTRTSSGATNLIIQATAESPVNGSELIAATPLTANDRGRITDTERGILFASEGGAYPEGYVLGDRVTCSDSGDPAGACNRLAAGGGRSTAMSFEYAGDDAPTHVLVNIYGIGPRLWLDPASHGWSLTEVRSPSVTLTSSKDHQAAGVQSRFIGGAEVFLKATARGGSRGSMVLAQPPCGYPPSLGFVNGGIGYSKLSGGKKDRESLCPGIYIANDDGYYAMTTHARSKTRWVLEGAVVGNTFTMGTTRLVVTDLTPDLIRALR